MVEDDRTRKALLGRVDAALVSHAKLHDELLAIKRAIEGTNPVKDAMTFFDEQWQALYTHGFCPSVHYEFNRTIDPGHMKRLLGKWSLDILKARMTAYFADTDPFLRKNHHPMNLFISRINTYVPRLGSVAINGDAGQFDYELPADCHHTPRCRDEIGCTAKRRSERRA
jgi:hypothetical protein